MAPKLLVHWCEWSSDQKGEEIKIVPRDNATLTCEQARPFVALGEGRSAKGAALKEAPGAISVQFWVDIPEGSARGDDAVGALLATAAERIAGLASRREPRVEDFLPALLQQWVSGVRATSPAEAAGPSSDRDVVCRQVGDCRAMMVGLVNRLRDAKGWKDSGESLMLSVGPDRYGIRVRTGKEVGGDGFITLPNARFRVGLQLAVAGLKAECDELVRDARRLQLDEVLVSEPRQGVGELLDQTKRLMSRHLDLEQRQEACQRAQKRLTSGWRLKAFNASPDSSADLKEIRSELAELRAELAEIPHLLLAISASHQARRTEQLAVLAAVLVVPSLIAGALGANILPWAAPTSSEPLFGMLALLLAGAATAFVVVRFWQTRRFAWVPAALAIAGFAGGLWLLLDGTKMNT